MRPARYLSNIQLSNSRAKYGTGLDDVKRILSKMLREDKVLIERTISYQEVGLLQTIRAHGELLEESYEPEGIAIRAYVPMEIYGKIR